MTVQLILKVFLTARVGLYIRTEYPLRGSERLSKGACRRFMGLYLPWTLKGLYGAGL